MSLVSEWMTNGTVVEYLKSHPRADRIQLAKDVAMGLQHIHPYDIIHRNLKGSSILVDERGQARLSGFGFASLDSDTSPPKLSTTASFPDSWRWSAPEILASEIEGSRTTTAVDIYALAMVLIEMFTGTVPFGEIDNPAAMVNQIIQGKRPDKHAPVSGSNMITDDIIWALIEKCWEQDPKDRPSMQFVVGELEKIPHTASTATM